MKLVRIADTPTEFVAAAEAAMNDDPAERLRETDAFLSQTSWNRTWGRMAELIEDVLDARRDASDIAPQVKVRATARAAVATRSFAGRD
jgi:UDP-galactopyranose mutase